MAQRKVFIDEIGNEITGYLFDAGGLIIEITSYSADETTRSIVLSKEDAKDFIMELYWIRNQINDKP